ncbi:MAG: CsiV family protein [Aquisalimonadaceae bacterium]
MPSGNTLLRYSYALLTTLLLSVGGHSAVHADTRDWYDVEIVIFRQHDSGNVQSAERWPLTPGPALFERYATVSGNSAENGDDVFRPLPEDSLGLRDSARRIQNSDAFEILLHTAWRQPGMPGGEAPAVHLPLDSEPPTVEELESEVESAPAEAETPEQVLTPAAPLPEGLSGYVRLVRERFLHFEVDLRLKAEESDDASDEAMRGIIPLFADEAHPVVVMKERRRMRSGELHYLDSPRLGVLVQVRVANRAD